jgi:hypothetical protein
MFTLVNATAVPSCAELSIKASCASVTYLLSVISGISPVSSNTVPISQFTEKTPPLGSAETGDFLVTPSALSRKTMKSSVVATQAGSPDILVGDILYRDYIVESHIWL